MSYVNAGPVSVVDGSPLDTPNDAVTSEGFDNFGPAFTANFDTEWMLGWNYFPNNYAVVSNAMVRFRMQPGSGALNVIMATREANGDFADRNSGSIPYVLGEDINLQPTRNAAGLIALMSGATTIVSATPPHPIAVNEGIIHWGNTTPGSDMVLSNINYVEANNDPTLDTPIADISVNTNATGVIANIGSSFSDADLDTLTYDVTPALPSGMTLDINSGDISGNGAITETAAADYTFSADDGQGGTPASDIVSIAVTAPVVTLGPVNGNAKAHKSLAAFTTNNPNTPTASSYEMFIDGNSCPFISRNADEFTWGMTTEVRALISQSNYSTLFRYTP